MPRRKKSVQRKPARKPSQKPVIAIDLGGTNIRAALVDSSGKILARDRTPTKAQDGMAAVVERIAALVEKLRTASTAAVAIGTPGVPDPLSGEYRLPAVNLPGSAGFPLTSTLSKKIKLPVLADNDGNLAALGEAWQGAGVGEKVVIVFTLGTGIGGGLVIGGNVYHGNHNLGTEFGHISIDDEGRKCPCGGTGCLEMYSSASALGRDARDALRSAQPPASVAGLLQRCGGEAGIERVDARMVCDAAKDGDPLAVFLFERCCRWLACGVGSMINALNPSCVIIGGGLALAGELLRKQVELELKTRAFAPILSDSKLRLAKLGDDAGLLGAARLAFAR